MTPILLHDLFCMMSFYIQMACKTQESQVNSMKVRMNLALDQLPEFLPVNCNNKCP